MIDLQERIFFGVRLLCRTESRGGGEGWTAVVTAQLHRWKLMKICKMFFLVFARSANIEQALSSAKLAAPAPLQRWPLTASFVQLSLPSIQSKSYPFLVSLNAIKINSS